MVPELEDNLVISIDRLPGSFLIHLDSGEVVTARRVVLAVGITHFEHLPSSLAHLPPEFLSHSARHHDLEGFRRRSVVVIGGGASATDLAGLLSDAGAEVQLVARQKSLRFHSMPTVGERQAWWRRIRHPQSGIGPGWRLRFFANSPMSFHYFPERLRLEAVRRSLGPAGGWFSKAKVIGRVPLVLGYAPEFAAVEGDAVRLHLRGADGTKREILTDHVIAATGYTVDLARLTFLSTEIRKALKAVNATPVLSSTFESSIPGLYFVGIAAANSFGPVLRFAFGANFAARNITRTMMSLASRGQVSRPVSSVPRPASDRTSSI